MKVIIAGGREFTDYELLKRECDRLLADLDVRRILSGCQRGADELGEQYAKENKIKIDPHPYKSELGLAGGPVRNREMAVQADIAIVFWDGKSKGSRDMINQMKRVNKPCYVIPYGEWEPEPEQGALFDEVKA